MEEKKELLDQDERVVEIELERLRGFVNHPFKVQADSQMIMMKRLYLWLIQIYNGK